MEKKIGLYMNLIMSPLIAAIFCVIGPLVANGSVDWSMYPVTFVLSSVVAFLSVTLIPVQKWGAALADALHFKPDSLPFAMVQNAVMVGIMSPIVMATINIYVVHIVFGAPIIAAIMSSLPDLPLLALIGWAMSMVLGPVCLKLAVRLAGVKAS